MIVLDTNKIEKRATRHAEKTSLYNQVQGIESCFYKELYFAERGGYYTVIAIFEPGAVYPKYRVIEGFVELFILKGALSCNGKEYSHGTFIQVAEGEFGDVRSDDGCEFLVTVKGKIENVRF